MSGKTYEDGQKHPSGITGKDAPQDSSLNAATSKEGLPSHGATVYLPGEGFMVSNGGWSSKSKRSVYQQKKRELVGDKKDIADDGQYLTEEEILNMAAVIQARRKMDGEKSARVKQFEKVKAARHPGTDAVDNSKSGIPCSRVDEFDVDKSQSRIFIGVSSIGPPGKALNGSKILHRQAVRITLTNPDGRRIADVSMSLEQFAAALVTNSHTPCTLDGYWSIDDDNVWLRERVRRPQSVYKRMKERMGDRTAEQKDLADKLVEELLEMADEGKTARKTKLREIAERVGRMSSYFEKNNAFAVQQAKEEISEIMESAAIQFIGHQIPPTEQALFDAAGPALTMDEEEADEAE